MRNVRGDAEGGHQDPSSKDCDAERLYQCSLIISQLMHTGGSPAAFCNMSMKVF